MLVSSVLIPARLTWRILRLLRETADVVEPARLLEARLAFGLAEESVALHEYAISGDDATLAHYRATVAEDERRLAALERLVARLDDDSVDVGAVRRRIAEWRRQSGVVAAGQPSRARFAAAVRGQQASRDAMLHEVTRLALHLAGEAASRRERVGIDERLSLLANASLVLVALAAVLTVAALVARERDLASALERVMKSRSRLVRGFSHDLKNPLGAADGYAELLLADIYGELSAEQRLSVERMRRSIRGALALIDDLHELARAETGHLAIAVSPVDLGALVRAIGEDYRAAAASRGLSLSVNVPADPPSLVTDPARVRQIVGNLLTNAIKYTESGSVTLGVRTDRPGELEGERAEGGAHAGIEVADTGPGIPAAERRAIFEEFVRLGGGRVAGAGLGLAISARLADALGGRIALDSEPGRGSTFTLWLPLR